jgi:Membrane bound O-acyl transferase family
MSSSPSDFWGRRWNKPIASGLRGGVFRPCRKMGLSRLAATAVTFLASGLLHEYMLVVMTLRGGFRNNPSGSNFVPRFGNHFAFFAWNGVVLLLERLLSEHSTSVQWVKNSLPPQARTWVVLLTVLPIAHLFTDEYVASCFYSDIALGFPMLVLKPTDE